MDHLELLNKILLEELIKTEKTLEATKIARDNAPSAMESRSDTSMSRLENEVTMYESRIKELKDFVNFIPREKPKSNKIGLWNLVGIDLPGGKLLISIVPEGMGGKKADDIQFVSNKTPIAVALIGKKDEDEFLFNETSGKIVSVN